jgi:hypothetical protein
MIFIRFWYRPIFDIIDVSSEGSLSEQDLRLVPPSSPYSQTLNPKP